MAHRAVAYHLDLVRDRRESSRPLFMSAIIDRIHSPVRDIQYAEGLFGYSLLMSALAVNLRMSEFPGTDLIGETNKVDLAATRYIQPNILIFESMRA